MSSPLRTRRRFLKDSLAAGAGTALTGELSLRAAETTDHHQAMGTKVGEVTPTSALIWARLTAKSERVPASGSNEQPQAELLEGACPGAPGRLRVRYGTRVDLTDAKATDWVEVKAEGDFHHQFALTDLQPATTYYYASSTDRTGAFTGKFTTAPAENTPTDLRFCVTTCQQYSDRDHPDGHPIYPAMLEFDPHFVCFTGDNVYYDHDAPNARTPELARYHWQRMFSLPRQIALLRATASYFQKDDHDTLSDDSEPGDHYGQLTWADGQRIFRQQVPFPAAGVSYRTFRWGRDLQIWLTDGRDSRSPKRMTDGPEKTIWGPEQKEWFKRTVAASTATWKVLVTPTPIVGPDRKKKNDNHTNEGFQHEGDELRAWMQAHVPERFFSVTGDRHWQYHSVHPQTKVREFACGPASNSHASGSPGFNPEYHQFHRVSGGFLSVTIQAKGGESTLRCEHRSVEGKVVHQWEAKAAV